AKVHDCAADRGRPPVLQPSCTADILDLCELVGRSAWIRGRRPLSESNQRTYVRSTGRNLVVGTAEVITMATQQVRTSSAPVQAVSTFTAPVSWFYALIGAKPNSRR